MIEAFSFGRIQVDGVSYSVDIKIINDRVVPQWWRSNGHIVEIEDVRDILEVKPEVLIIGKGEPGLMRTDASLKKELKKNHIRLIEEKTISAIRKFNQMAATGIHVSAGFHVGC